MLTVVVSYSVSQLCVKYPRVSYTDLDNLICKKSEEEVHSEAEGGEHSGRPAHQPVLSEAVPLAGSAVCSTYQLCGCSMPSFGMRPSRSTHKVVGDKGYSDLQIKSSKSV